MTRHRLIHAAIWVALAATAFGVMVAVDAAERRRLAPPSGAHTLPQFAAQMPEARHLAVVKHDGRTVVVWIGELASSITLPSGRACYVFDDRGRLADWCPETGEGHALDKLCGKAWRAHSVSVREALQQIGQPAEPR